MAHRQHKEFSSFSFLSPIFWISEFFRVLLNATNDSCSVSLPRAGLCSKSQGAALNPKVHRDNKITCIIASQGKLRGPITVKLRGPLHRDWRYYLSDWARNCDCPPLGDLGWEITLWIPPLWKTPSQANQHDLGLDHFGGYHRNQNYSKKSFQKCFFEAINL